MGAKGTAKRHLATCSPLYYFDGTDIHHGWAGFFRQFWKGSRGRRHHLAGLGLYRWNRTEEYGGKKNGYEAKNTAACDIHVSLMTVIFFHDTILSSLSLVLYSVSVHRFRAQRSRLGTGTKLKTRGPRKKCWFYYTIAKYHVSDPPASPVMYWSGISKEVDFPVQNV